MNCTTKLCKTIFTGASLCVDFSLTSSLRLQVYGPRVTLQQNWMLGQPLSSGQSNIDQLVEIIKILRTPTRGQMRTMSSNYLDDKSPKIKHALSASSSVPRLYRFTQVQGDPSQVRTCTRKGLDMARSVKIQRSRENVSLHIRGLTTRPLPIGEMNESNEPVCTLTKTAMIATSISWEYPLSPNSYPTSVSIYIYRQCVDAQERENGRQGSDAGSINQGGDDHTRSCSGNHRLRGCRISRPGSDSDSERQSAMTFPRMSTCNQGLEKERGGCHGGPCTREIQRQSHRGPFCREYVDPDRKQKEITFFQCR